MSQKQKPTIKECFQLQYKQLPNDQFFIYSIIHKLSSTGMTYNQRLLFLDSSSKILQYSHQPDEQQLPLKSAPINYKEKVNICEKNIMFRFQPSKTNIGSVHVSWFQNKLPKSWDFRFTNTKVMNIWVEIVYKVLQNNYKVNKKRNQGNPIKDIIYSPRHNKSVSKQKYQTSFVKELSKLDHSKIPIEAINNDQFITNLVQEKEKKKDQEERKRAMTMIPKSNSQTLKQKYEKQLNLIGEKSNNQLYKNQSRQIISPKQQKQFRQETPALPPVPKVQQSTFPSSKDVHKQSHIKIQISQQREKQQISIEQILSSAIKQHSDSNTIKNNIQQNPTIKKSHNSINSKLYSQNDQKSMRMSNRSDNKVGKIIPNKVNWHKYQNQKEYLKLYTQFCKLCQKLTIQIIHNRRQSDRFQRQLIEKNIQLEIQQNNQKGSKKIQNIFIAYNTLGKILTQIKRQVKQNIKNQKQNQIINYYLPFYCKCEYLGYTILFHVNLEQPIKRLQINHNSYLKQLVQQMTLYNNNNNPELMFQCFNTNKILSIQSICQIQFEVTYNFINRNLLAKLSQLKSPQNPNIDFKSIKKYRIQYLSEFLLKIQSQQICTCYHLIKFIKSQGILVRKDIQILYKKSTNQYQKKIFGSQVTLITILQEVNVKMLQYGKEQEGKNLVSNVLEFIYKLINQIMQWKNSYILSLLEKVNKEFNNIKINQKDIEKMYLISGIIISLNIQYNFIELPFQKISQQSLRKINPSLTMYEKESMGIILIQISEQSLLQDEIKDYKQILQLLKQNPYLTKLTQQEITKYLCNYIPPNDPQQLMQPLYPTGNSFFPDNIQLRILSMKWHMKKHHEYANSIFTQLKNMLQLWAPFSYTLTTLINIYVMYLEQRGRYSQMTKYILKNKDRMELYYHSNSLQVCEQYFLLLNSYMVTEDYEKALQSCNNIKNILQINHQQGLAQYSKIILKISLIYLQKKQIKQSVENALKVIKLCQQYQLNVQIEIEAFQLLNRNYQIIKKYQKMAKLTIQCLKKNLKIVNIINFKILLRMYINSQILLMNSYQKEGFRQFVKKIQIPNQQSQKAYEFLRDVQTDKILLFNQCCSKSLKFEGQIKHSRQTNWGQAATQLQWIINIIQAISILLGKKYMLIFIDDLQ